MKLTEQELKGYLGTGLKGQVEWKHKNTFYNVELYGILSSDLQIENPFGGSDYCDISEFKPILHPLSDLTKFREDLGFVPLNEILNCEYYGYSELRYMIENNNFYLLPSISFQLNNILMQWHFDIFDLIKNNLAIDINTT